MRLIKLSFLFAVLAGLSSCLKSKNDIAGILNDKGGIVTSIAEQEYIDQDNLLIGFGYYATTSFDFASLPNEAVKFLSVHVSQPRDVKVVGTLKLGFTASNGGGTPLPAGALTLSVAQIPAFDGPAKDFNIKFAVNKTLLNPAASYSVVITLATADQGIISENAKSIEVWITNGKYYGRYMVETTVTDPLNFVTIIKNTKPVLLDDPAYWGTFPAASPSFVFVDEYYAGILGGGSNFYLSTLVNNLTSGNTAVRYGLLFPTFQLNASGTLTQIVNSLTGASYGITLNTDAPNNFVYAANDDRTFSISYNVTLTAPIPGGTSSRVFKVVEKYTYHPIQVRVF